MCSNHPSPLSDLDWEIISNQDLMHTPASSQLSQYDPIFDCSTSNAISEAGFSSISSEPFSPDRPHGLGLYLPSIDIDNRYKVDEHTSRPQQVDTPCVSTAALAVPGLPIVDPQCLINEPVFVDPYHASTPVPGTPWNTLDSTIHGPSNVPSPNPSSYSIMSYYTPVQSPFAHADSAVRLGASPYIKLEPAFDDTILPLNHRCAIKQSPQTSPWNSFHHVPETVEERVAMFLTPDQMSHTTVSTANDEYFTEHPTRPRAFSSDDAQLRAPNRRKKRKYTTEENAKLSCQVCGKLFQRKFNHRKHMETHQPFRFQPFACEYEGCNKGFGRRTDLTRHEKSKHLQVRDYSCRLCGNAFARKDTWIRHEDYGCKLRARVKHRVQKTSIGLGSPVRRSVRAVTR